MKINLTSAITALQQKRPLVLNITNSVTTEFVANGLLSIGASPIMTEAVQELEALLDIAQGLVINIGTLNDGFMLLADAACEIAEALGKPVILDPVGAGASRYRTDYCLALLSKYSIQVIRGNASEIVALVGGNHNTKGVDTMTDSIESLSYAKALSKQAQSVVVVSGPTDIVVEDERIAFNETGSPLMPMVTGTGCLLSAVVGAFNCVFPTPFEASLLAVSYYGQAGLAAQAHAKGPGTFKEAFLDALANPAEGGPL